MILLFRKFFLRCLIVVVFFWLNSKNTIDAKIPGGIPVYTYKIVNSYPHDSMAFTQGLAFEDNVLYESTGIYGQSKLLGKQLETGDILQKVDLSPELFGEGITLYRNKIFQLTWKSHIGLVYDKESFELLRKFYYPTEGWGITHDGNRLITSDGSSTLRFLNPETFEELTTVDVYDTNGMVKNLNELEYVQGEIYANVWQTDLIARIAPQTGQVVGWIDLEGLLASEKTGKLCDVLNGIAYDEKNDRLFVTGKRWPKLFEIDLLLVENERPLRMPGER
ncbi:MAG: glutaminyl-peptide cyclotransferase [Candidatus Brocadiaceae bacterium]|nr:glutaminyl-peptide cyclotransferase [Candidatus Brocadiaceae bacterium]